MSFPNGHDATAAHLGALGVHYSHVPLDRQVETFGHLKFREASTLNKDTSGLEEVLAFTRKPHFYDIELPHYVTGGSGIFHLKGEADEWVAVRVKAGDLLTLPPRMVHTFDLDEGQSITMYNPMDIDPNTLAPVVVE
eukprot:Opistho-2@30454